jgi:hypothetical protein
MSDKSDAGRGPRSEATGRADLGAALAEGDPQKVVPANLEKREQILEE